MNQTFEGEVVIDYEGPLAKNNNAKALCSYFIPQGDVLFNKIGIYDQINTQLEKKEGTKPSQILLYILPFLKGYGADNQKVEEYCAANIQLLPGADKFLQWIIKKYNTFIISNSYSRNIHALCKLTGFKEENTKSVYADFDKCQPTISEKENIRDMAAEIIQLPLKMPKEAVDSVQNLPSLIRQSFDKINTILSEEIPKMSMGKYFIDVKPLDKIAKTQFLFDSIEECGINLEQVIYIGDNISDVEAMSMVKQAGGLTISFNGDQHSIKEADIACMAANSTILGILCDYFFQNGKKSVLNLVKDWGTDKLANLDSDKLFIENLLSSDIQLFPRLEIIYDNNFEALAKESKQWRSMILETTNTDF